jgi:tetratricopeptide (TPR) repeat protein
MENKAKHNKMKHRDIIKMVKRNEAQEFVTGAEHFFKKNMESVIIAGIAALIIIVAIPLFLNFRATNNQKAEQALSEANYYINRPVLDDPQASMYGFFRTNKEKYEKSQSAYMSVLQDYKGTDAVPDAYLGIANSYYANGQYKEAIEYYNSFISKFPKDALIAEAYSGKAYALFQTGQYGDAVKEWETVLKKYNGGNNPDDIKLRIAESYLQAGNKPAAKAICDEIIKSGRDNYWTSAAKALALKVQ